MARFPLETLFYALLVTIAITLAFSTRSIRYINPTANKPSTMRDVFLQVAYDLDYLQLHISRLDRIIRIIYFGFLAALFYLGFCYGRLQGKIGNLEGKVKGLTCATKGVKGAMGVGHPAYGTFERDLANEASLKMVYRDLGRLGIERQVDVLRIEALEKEIKRMLAQCGSNEEEEEEEEEKMAPPAYSAGEEGVVGKVSNSANSLRQLRAMTDSSP
ncbi:hypothetical protein IQ06DRAFT_310750 [Phaeosphaeriaceae sp. SRC1lsM3a]|nr:hypothetical protein IQ06DRAFT_310750 [Stagonospora sp. SRC1lsM3a]